jgi:hypothetical protein
MFLQIRRLIVSTISVHLGPGDNRGIMLSQIATDLFRVPAKKPVPFYLKKWSAWLECTDIRAGREAVQYANRLSEIVETLASARSLVKASKAQDIGTDETHRSRARANLICRRLRPLFYAVVGTRRGRRVEEGGTISAHVLGIRRIDGQMSGGEVPKRSTIPLL